MNLAVILVAGFGSRLEGLLGDKPKGFLPIGDTTLIHRAISLLQQCGIQEIILVTGHAAAYYQALAEKMPGVTTCFNPQYPTKGTLWSLLSPLERINRPFVFLEGDLLFTRSCISTLIAAPHLNSVLVSGMLGFGDEYYVDATADGRLVGFSADPALMDNLIGEFVGINKLTPESLRAIKAWSDTAYRHKEDLRYHDGLAAIAEDAPVMVEYDPDLLWAEVDDAHQYEIVKRIYPQIIEADHD